jgi:DNA invertase Pin-like site-specific DNA recombinase
MLRDAHRKHKAKLVIAKLDRLSRNLAFIATLMDSGVEFVAADNPHANRLTVHILAAVAEYERAAISERIKAALPPERGILRPKPALRRGWQHQQPHQEDSSAIIVAHVM